jgi:hypothetical protein
MGMDGCDYDLLWLLPHVQIMAAFASVICQQQPSCPRHRARHTRYTKTNEGRQGEFANHHAVAPGASCWLVTCRPIFV